MRLLSFVILVAFITGCSGETTRPSGEFQRRRAALADREITLPTTTPFDDDPDDQAIYLEWYWFGYRTALSGSGSSFYGNGHPKYEVQHKGFTDGLTAGFQEYRAAMASP